MLKNYCMKKLAHGISDINKKFHMPSTHAEVDAILKIIKYRNIPKEVDLLIIKKDYNGNLTNSKPCLHCAKFIIRKYKQIFIRNIYYSNEQGTISKINILDLYQDLSSCYITGGFKRKKSKKVKNK